MEAKIFKRLDFTINGVYHNSRREIVEPLVATGKVAGILVILESDEDPPSGEVLLRKDLTHYRIFSCRCLSAKAIWTASDLRLHLEHTSIAFQWYSQSHVLKGSGWSFVPLSIPMAFISGSEGGVLLEKVF